MHQRREKATAWFARAPENLIIFVGTGGKLAVSPRRDFPSSDSPRLIESVCKQRHRLVQPRCVCVCVCVSRNRGRKKRDLFPLETRQTRFYLLLPLPRDAFPIRISVLKRVSTTAPFLFFRTNSIIWFIYVWVTSSWPIDIVWAYVEWRVDDARNRFCNGSRANAPTSKLSNYTRGRGNYS